MNLKRHSKFGGLAAGGVVLLGGEPGIGKSTLLAQVAAAVARSRATVNTLFRMASVAG